MRGRLAGFSPASYMDSNLGTQNMRQTSSVISLHLSKDVTVVDAVTSAFILDIAIQTQVAYTTPPTHLLSFILAV